MSASPSMLGGSRVQYHLRQVCVSINLLPLSKPEVFIARAHTKFDEEGNWIDKRTKKAIKIYYLLLLKLNLLRACSSWDGLFFVEDIFCRTIIYNCKYYRNKYTH